MTTTPCNSGGYAASPKLTQSQDWVEGGRKKIEYLLQKSYYVKKKFKKMPLDLANLNEGVERKKMNRIVFHRAQLLLYIHTRTYLIHSCIITI